ncbi:MAG: NAD(P)H-dependent oxidoreductase [bacterium]|nr:NAD(P)H-dependent oxidoreductase [bacterium]
MSRAPKILAFSGSARTGSFNKLLVQVAAVGARDAGAEVTYVDLRDLPMPLYDGDLEECDGMPANAQTFRELMIEHDGFLISSPENNRSISSLLKNTIDWASRKFRDLPGNAAYKGKVAAIMSASPGGLGGLRGLYHLRDILVSMGTMVLPDQRAVSGAMKAFNSDGDIEDEKMREGIRAIGAKLADTIRKLNDLG